MEFNESFGPIGWADVLTASGRAALRNTGMSESCANETPKSLTVGTTDYYVQHYVFPAQFVAGVLGNSINLIVLLSSGMKNQANILLSAIAFADLGFLIALLPFSLASFEIFYSSQLFAFVFHRYKIHGVALANTFSIAASWLVLAVSIERFSGVRRPMHARFQVRERRLYSLIAMVFVLAFITTFWHHIEYTKKIYVHCSIVRPFYKLVDDIPGTSKLLLKYLTYARLFQSIAGILLPVTAVAIFNVSLIYYLRKREILPRTVSDNKQPEFRRYSDIGPLQRQERKVTATVIAIVTCFSVTHLPTLGPIIWKHIYNTDTFSPDIQYITITLLNTLLISGKTLNFVLFCLSSAHFRRRTVLIFAKICRNSQRKKFASLATQSTLNNAKLSNAGSFQHSITLHQTDSVDLPLHQLQRSCTASSSASTPRGVQRVHMQLANPPQQSSLIREDSIDLPCSSSGTPTVRSHEAEPTKPRRIFGLHLNNIGRSLRKSTVRI
ncbi:G-PROTEIN-RECEP-F1-2 domain-containing protein [Aphelenchoides besseyi]|nr:G-PROTEIN-RECEP-F1-2 domain-containing protein [Aphelenchoides besseyi]KAI6212127.1 G-PROTEIN-RECEP-F1-2 domain-containing protein [Aphelenchoides besseyi]